MRWTALIVLATGCATSQHSTSARVLKPGFESFRVANNAGFSYGRGITEEIDASANVTGPGMVAVDARYQIFDTDRFASALGAAVAYQERAPEYGTSDERQVVLDLEVPLYSSYELSDSVVVYYARRYIFRLVQESNPHHLLAGSGGIRIGKEWGIDLEGTYAYDFSDASKVMRINGAVFF